MFKKIKKFLVSDEELDIEWQKLLSLIFLLIAGSMSFFPYARNGFIPWINKPLTFKPDFVATIIAIVLVAPLYLRNILKWHKSVYSLISFILILMVFASFVKLAMGGSTGNRIIFSLIAISIALSWLGLKSIAGISWILMLGAAVYSVNTNNIALGFYGFVYVTLGFLGLILHTGLNPGALLKNLKEEYAMPVTSAVNVVKDDIAESGKLANNIAGHFT